MSGYARKGGDPSNVRKALGAPNPTASDGYELNPNVKKSITEELVAETSNAVAQEMSEDQAERTPEEEAAATLAGEFGTSTLDAAASQMAAAPVKAEPDDAVEDAVRGMAAGSGGSSLDGGVAQEAEAVLGIDTGGVTVHTEEPAVDAIDGGAATIGTDIYFAPGHFRPETTEGKALLYEELAHAGGDVSSDPMGAVTLGGTDNATEESGGAIYNAVMNGETIDPADVAGAAAAPNTVQRGEAGVHQNEITMPGLGVRPAGMAGLNNPNTEGNDGHQFGGWRHRNSENLGPDQRAAMEIYAGNFMSDFSQANVPKALSIMGQVHDALPTVAGAPSGAEAGGTLLQAVIHALAILELGSEAASLVTAQMTEMYEAERHMDNPMGTMASDYVVNAGGTDTANAVAEVPAELLENPATAVSTTTPDTEHGGSSDEFAEAAHEMTWKGGVEASRRSLARPAEDGQANAADVQAATAEIHAGSAVPGLQFDNPALFQVSGAGIGNHLYNSIEASKNSYISAAQAGPTPVGRMHVGYADHIIQDYFSHSNFIEVALNKYINDAIANGAGEGAEAGHDAHEDHEEPGHDHAAHDHDHDHDGGREHLEDRDDFFRALRANGPVREADEERGVQANFVATMFDASVDTPMPDGSVEHRDAITTGSFGGTDTMISIAHTFMPFLPRLHESMQNSVDTVLGLIESAPAGGGWDSIGSMLMSSGRDGEVLHTLLGALGETGVGVTIPNGVELNMTEIQVSPGWFGDPWTVDVPDITDPLNVTHGNFMITDAVGAFISVGQQINRVKNGVSRFAEFIGIDSVVRAIDAAWDALKAEIKAQIQQALNAMLTQMLTAMASELSDGEVTPEQLSAAAGGGFDAAFALANEAMHGAEQRTSIGYRLDQGDMAVSSRAAGALDTADMNNDGETTGSEQGDLAARLRAADTNQDGTVSEDERAGWIQAQREELERRVGPVTGDGTPASPWVPLAPLPPSHSEIGKDHPPHNPSFHEHEDHEHDHNPTILNPGSDPVDIIDTQADDKARALAHDQTMDAHHEEHAAQNEEHSGGAGGHDHEHGSSFFGIGVTLALEAQRHMYSQMELVWQEMTGDRTRRMTDHTDAQGNRVGGAEGDALSEHASTERLSAMGVGHDVISAEADRVAALEEERNAQRGFHRAQEDERNAGTFEQSPALQRLCNMVDLFVSHPNESSWWNSIVDGYVAANPDEVYQHILRRNAMAANMLRQAPGGH